MKVDFASSTVRPLHWGVPQGSVLGPMLYLLYTSPLGDIVREHGLSFHFYADHSQFYTSFACNDTSDLVAEKQRLENCVADINLWMTANKLKLNNDTSEFLFLYSFCTNCRMRSAMMMATFFEAAVCVAFLCLLCL